MQNPTATVEVSGTIDLSSGTAMSIDPSGMAHVMSVLTNLYAGEGEHARSERARTPDAGQRSSDVIPNDNAEHASELVAANGLRLLAFTIDLLLIAVATIPIAMAETDSRPFMFVTVLLAFVLYHAASVWLTSGKTIGKAACNLTVRRYCRSA